VTALLRMADTLTLERVALLLKSTHGGDLADVTIRHICTVEPRRSIWLDSSGSIEDAVMRGFQLLPHAWLSSSFFVRHVGLERWTAQSLLAELADRGWLERRGKTSGTRYRLSRLPDPRRQPAEVPNDDE
jgi:hypothetical protein